MTSKTVRRRNKRRKLAGDLPELAETPKRQPNGQRRERSDAPRDPRKTALDARCRIFGVPPTKANRSALSGQHSGSQLGMVIEKLSRPRDIARLWSVWQGFCAAERTYRLRYLGQSGTAKGAAIAMVPDRMESDQSHSIDTRDPDQRDRDAVNNWMRWRGCIGHLHASEQRLLHMAEQDIERVLWSDEAPTQRGIATYEALRRMADVVEQRNR